MLIKNAKQCLETEADAVRELVNRIDNNFVVAAEKIIACHGRVVVCGMGKSGHIAQKIAATLASTGTPAFFLHPAEAIHGDLGMVTADDIVLAISNSGESNELLAIIPTIRRIGAEIIAMTGKSTSTLAKAACAILDCSVEKEACPLGLAPTSSTTATLAMGDALAVALLAERKFTSEDFALYHPGGALGKKLLLKVGDLMHSEADNPKLTGDRPLKEALFLMTSKGLGAVNIVDGDNKLLGLITDGDIRRRLELGCNLLELTTFEIMTRNPKVAKVDQMAVDALNMMERNKPTPITVLPVVDVDNNAVGMIHITDLVKSGIV
ncbi:MAG: KpsF/GutQ family sugar-phosphate isomerase [Bacillota bacterium]